MAKKAKKIKLERKPVVEVEEVENDTIKAYQKKGDGEWELIEVPFIRKKKL